MVVGARIVVVAIAAVATALAAAGAAAWLAGREPPAASARAAGLAAGAAAAPLAPCRARVRRGVLPVWARTGFSDPRPRMPHVLGRRGLLAALLFGDPLSAPESRDHGNKILWVSRPPLSGPADLRLAARRVEGGRFVGRSVVRVVAGGPGPSLIDLPRPGCWRVRAAWAGHRDTLDLVYRSPGA